MTVKANQSTCVHPCMVLPPPKKRTLCCPGGVSFSPTWQDNGIEAQITTAQKRTKLDGSIYATMFPPQTPHIHHKSGTCLTRPPFLDSTTATIAGDIITKDINMNSCSFTHVVPLVSLEWSQEGDEAPHWSDCLTVSTTTATSTSITTSNPSSKNKNTPQRMVRRNSFLIPNHKREGMLPLLEETRRRATNEEGAMLLQQLQEAGHVDDQRKTKN